MLHADAKLQKDLAIGELLAMQVRGTNRECRLSHASPAGKHYHRHGERGAVRVPEHDFADFGEDLRAPGELANGPRQLVRGQPRADPAGPSFLVLETRRVDLGATDEYGLF